MQNFIVFLIGIILAVYIQYIIGVPVAHENDHIEKLLPNGNFSLVTNEKLIRLKELANAADDPKLSDLYRAVDHYVQIAGKNNEYVLWKYDVNQGGLVLILKQNLNRILYYG